MTAIPGARREPWEPGWAHDKVAIPSAVIWRITISLAFMHSRRLATIVGVWLGLTVAMAFVATQNFMGVERLLEAPGPDAARMIDKLGHDPARMLLRFQISELNRFFFDGLASPRSALLFSWPLPFCLPPMGTS